MKKDASNVYVGALCPGPVDTEFNKVAKVKFNLPSVDSSYVCNYAIKQMNKRKMIIIPSVKTKIGVYLAKILPMNLKLKVSYNIQERKDR